MRVIAGAAKGTRLKAPRSASVRPTSDRAKQVLFDTLHSLMPLPARIVDLFAGSGALGIEALSRGAEHADFVERDRAALHHLRQNIEKTGFASRSAVHQADVFAFLARQENAGLMLLFADPPYGSNLADRLLDTLRRKNVVQTGGVLVLEVARRTQMGPMTGFSIAAEKNAGDTRLLFLQRCEGE